MTHRQLTPLFSEDHPASFTTSDSRVVLESSYLPVASLEMDGDVSFVEVQHCPLYYEMDSTEPFFLLPAGSLHPVCALVTRRQLARL